MINERAKSDIEQGIAGIAEMLGMFYRSLLAEGFTEQQAMQLTCTYAATAFKPS